MQNYATHSKSSSEAHAATRDRRARRLRILGPPALRRVDLIEALPVTERTDDDLAYLEAWRLAEALPCNIGTAVRALLDFHRDRADVRRARRQKQAAPSTRQPEAMAA